MSEPEQGNRCTQQAREVLHLAWQEAERLHHDHIGTDHLLLGLLAQGQGVAAQVLQQFGVELQTVREKIASIYGDQDHPLIAELPWASRTRKVLRRAEEEAGNLKEHLIGTEHLLLGLTHDGDTMAAAILMSLRITPEQVHREALRRLGES